jgi:methyl-accepting chemotaxis protein
MHKVLGEAASTNAKATDINRTTTDMAEGMKTMAKNIEEIGDTLNNVESMIAKLSETCDACYGLKKGMKEMEGNIVDKIDVYKEYYRLYACR